MGQALTSDASAAGGDHPAPGWFDVQLNGYAGVDLNAPDLPLESVERMCARLADDGVGGVLATIITDALPRMARHIERLAAFCERSPIVRRIVRGIHVEGPFLNESIGYIGAHPAREVRPACIDDARRLHDAGAGLVRLMTLAPERDDRLAVTRHLVEAGVRVSAGHCDPSLDLLTEAVDAGLSLFTHLGNGCAATMYRHDNVIQRALSLSDRLWCCFIADGAHVPWFVLGNYIRCATPDRCVIVTDAMAAAGLGPGRYTLGELMLDVGDDMVARYGDSGYLAGSCTTMPATAANLAQHLRLDADTIDLMMRINPRRAIGVDQADAPAAAGEEAGHE